MMPQNKMAGAPSVLILGIGNILWADEGFGVRAVEALHEAYRFPAHVALVDGGTQGLGLLPLVEDADILLIFDAVDYGVAPGALQLVDDDDVPRYLTAKKMSLHQTSFQDVLGLAELSGRKPARMRLIGVQPCDLETYGGSLSAPVREKINAALAEALTFLAAAGVAYEPRAEGDKPAPLAPPSVSFGAYEAGQSFDLVNTKDLISNEEAGSK